MSHRVVLCLEYDGTRYAGWQRQENALSVQQVLEDALCKLTNESVVIYSAGRTDAGVHALGQAAHFDTNATIPPDRFAPALNGILPRDIRVSRSLPVTERFHARFSAMSKEYRYYMFLREQACALFSHQVWGLPGSMDVDAMGRAAAMIVGRRDFAAFQAAGSSVRDTVRIVYGITIEQRGGLIEIAVKGEGFLYNMVRIMVGTLYLVGRGKMTANQVQDILASGNRQLAGATAPAQGLFLWNIIYDAFQTRQDAPFIG